MLYLEFLTPDADSFVPVHFSYMNRSIDQLNTSDSLAFSPTTSPIQASQSGDFADSGAYSELSISEMSPTIRNA
jgi:hypothetical protein